MIALPFIYFTLLGLYFLINRRRFSMDIAAVSILIIISFCAIMIDIYSLYGAYGINNLSYNLFTLILFCIQWTVVLLPMHLLSQRKIVAPDPIKVKSLLVVCILLIASSILMIISSIGEIKDALLMEMVDVRAQHYKDLNTGAEKGSYLMALPQLLVTVPFPTIALILLFYLCSFIEGKIVIKIGLFVASIVQAILSIIMAGRAAMIYWIFDFYLIFCFVYPYLSYKIKKVIVTTSIAMSILMGIVFVIITLSRFDNGDSRNDPMESLYAYAGQHVNNFSIMILEGHKVPYSIDREFPFISKTLFHKVYDMNDHYNAVSKYAKMTPNVFDTFGGEVYVDLGIVGYVLLLFLLMCFSIFLQSNWQEITLSRILFVGIYITFFTHGIFAWPFVGHYTSLAIMLIIFLAIFFANRFRI